jgi:phospholipid/cholesterol/gamma-HCH transport system substrate-binding protein
VAASVSRIARSFESELVQSGALRDLRQSVTATRQLVDQMRVTVAEQNRNLSATLSSLRGAVDSAQIAATVRTFRETTANADSLMLRLSSNTTQLQAILARLERGEGTAGKFLSDTSLYRDARNLLTRVDSLVTDFQRNPRKYINLRVF